MSVSDKEWEKAASALDDISGESSSRVPARKSRFGPKGKIIVGVLIAIGVAVGAYAVGTALDSNQYTTSEEGAGTS